MWWRAIASLAVCGVLAAGLGAAATTQRRAVDPIEDTLRPLVMVLQHEDEIALANDNKEAIAAKMQQAVGKLSEQKAALAREVDSLGQIFAADQPDETRALAQLDKVLEAERVIKRARMSLALEIKGQLTHEQQAKLREIRQKAVSTGPIPATVSAKMQQAMESLRQAKSQGRDVSEATKVLLQVQGMQEQGKFQEAEEGLDRAIKMLTPEKK